MIIENANCEPWVDCMMEADTKFGNNDDEISIAEIIRQFKAKKTFSPCADEWPKENKSAMSEKAYLAM